MADRKIDKTSKHVGDADHLKVFANVDAAEKWFEENDPEGVAFDQQHAHDHAAADVVHSFIHKQDPVIDKELVRYQAWEGTLAVDWGSQYSFA